MLVACTCAVWGAGPELSDGEIARRTSDPTSNLWSLETVVSYGVTPSASFGEASLFTVEFEPAMPVMVTPELRLLNLPELTLATQWGPGGGQISGLQSFSWLSALSPVAKPLGPSWGVGPYVSFPVSSDAGLDPIQWQFGGGAIFSWRFPNLILSSTVRTGWAATRLDEEAGSLQVEWTAQYFFGDGMQVGLGHPTIEYTWNRDGVGVWDVPVGVDVGKVFRIGRLPVKVMLEYQFVPINDSEWEPEHLIRLTIMPVLPSPMEGAIFGE